VMIIGLLALYPASRLDYAVIAQMSASTFALVPGGSTFPPPRGWLTTFYHYTLSAFTPAVLLAAAAALVLLCVSGTWNIGPARAGLRPDAPVLGKPPGAADVTYADRAEPPRLPLLPRLRGARAGSWQAVRPDRHQGPNG
jgi:hypothetical protein